MIDPGLSQKTVLVTGGAANIGAAISRAFAEQGARVVVHYAPGETAWGHHGRAATDPHAFVSSLPDAIGISEDFLTPGAAARLMDTVENQIGPVDVLINNAALANDADTFSAIDDTAIEQTLRVNTLAPPCSSRNCPGACQSTLRPTLPTSSTSLPTQPGASPTRFPMGCRKQPSNL